MGVTAQIERDEAEPRPPDLLPALFDAIDVLVLATDGSGRIRWANRAATSMFDASAAQDPIGRPLWEVPWRMPSAAERERLREAVAEAAAGGRASGTVDLLAADGRVVAIDFSVKPLAEGRGAAMLVFEGRDVSSRKAAEAKLRQQADVAHVMQLNTVGALTSAIGHEINQPLTAIMSYAQACQRMLSSMADLPAELRHAMSMIVAQAQRAGGIVRHAKDFTRKGELLRREEDINRIVLSAIDRQSPEARRRRVAIRPDLDAKLPLVAVDAIQIEQVVLSLIRNSVQAIAGADMNERAITVLTSVNEDGAVQIAVADTGPGISSAIAKRLFEPFVTSKADGMGVGLTICRSIINAHGGQLWADPRPGGGTVFRFTLPAVDGAAAHEV